MLLLSLLNRDSPESTPEEVVPVVADRVAAAETWGLPATPETPTVTPEGTASPQATSTSIPTPHPLTQQATFAWSWTRCPTSLALVRLLS